MMPRTPHSFERLTRLDKLVAAWLRHIEEAPGHSKPVTEGGQAMHNINPDATRIRCSTCAWQCEVGPRGGRR